MKIRSGLGIALVGLLSVAGVTTRAQSLVTASAKAATAEEIVNAARVEAAREPIAEKTVPLFTFDPLTPSGTYWMLQTDTPPLPFDPFPELMIFPLGGNAWLVDDRSVDYPALNAALASEAQARKFGLSTSSGGAQAMTLDSEGPPPPPGGGGGGGDTNDPPVFGPPVWLTGTQLCLLPPVFSGSNIVTLTWTNGIAGAPYDLFVTTNLAPGTTYLNLTNWLWLMRSVAGQTNFIVTNYPTPEAYFVLGTTNDSDSDGLSDAYEKLVSHGQTNLDSDGDGMPDAWEFGHGFNPRNPADAYEDPDDDGSTNLQEYQNGTDPLDSMLVVWSKDGSSEALAPWNLPGLRDMAGGGAAAFGGHTLMLTATNSVMAWGGNAFDKTNVPPAIGTNAVAVVAGGDQSAALLSNGTVTNWGRSFTNIPSGLANVKALATGYQHFLALKNDGTVLTWGRSNCPANAQLSGLSNVTAISAGWNHNLALRSYGTVAVWGLGTNALGWPLTNMPSGLTDIAAVSAGALHSVALRSNGTVVAWGYNQGGETNVPAGLSNITAIAAGRGYTLALKPDGTVTGWGAGLPVIPPGLSGVTKIAAGSGHALAIRSGVLTPLISRQPQGQGAAAGGSVTYRVAVASRSEPTYQWQFNGTNLIGATDATLTRSNVSAATQGSYRVRVSNRAGTVWSESAPFELVTAPQIVSPTNAVLLWVPPATNCTLNVVANAQGAEYVPLHYDWYRDDAPLGELGMPNLTVGQFGPVQPGDYWVVVTNTAGRATSAVRTVRTLDSGAVAAWGNLTNGLPPLGLTNAIALSAGQSHAVALTDDGTVVAWGGNSNGQTNVPMTLSNVIAIAAGDYHALALRTNGQVMAWGQNTYNQTNVPATLTNAMGIAAGSRFSLTLRNDGTVVAWGDNALGQTNVPSGLKDVKLLAASGDQALAGVFSMLTQYPVDVSKDLLLIYNAASTNSIWVKEYYLAHRPMVSNANVFAISCSTGERMGTNEYTTAIRGPVLNWLSSNPTKHPGYVILFLDIPAALTNDSDDTIWPGSVSWNLHEQFAGIRPFVTHINLRTTNDCKAYIDKLASFGAIYSPGKLLISPSSGGYSNLNYYLDDNWPPQLSPYQPGYLATVALTNAGVAPLSVFFDCNPGPGGILSNCTNVAGYFTWGQHAELGGFWPTNGAIVFGTNAGWYLLQTGESWNGLRGEPPTGQSTFLDWFCPIAFSGTNYSNTPAGAVSHVWEPAEPINNPQYFVLWARGRTFAACAWVSLFPSRGRASTIQAVGGPFVQR